MNVDIADNFAASEEWYREVPLTELRTQNWTAEWRDAGPSASEG